MNPTSAPCLTTMECFPALVEATFAHLEGRMAAPVALDVHRAAVLHVASELQRPLEEVAQLYCAELARLCPFAAVGDYLPILIAKKVREHLRAGAPTSHTAL